MTADASFDAHAVVALYSTITLRLPRHDPASDLQSFQADSFSELIGQPVHVPGLDATFTHLLVGVDVSDDRMTARLSIRTRLQRGADLSHHLNVALTTPEAHLRVVDDETGDVLLETTHSAPLVDGDHHRINGAPVRVVATAWPHRHPEFGAVQAHPETGEYPHDVQEVRVRRVNPPQVQHAPQ